VIDVGSAFGLINPSNLGLAGQTNNV
jgi:hypothetical protein